MFKRAACLFFYSCVVFAQVPADNSYEVKLRSYAAEPIPHTYTISGHDQAFLTKPLIASYTQFNPLDPKAIFTIRAYRDTEYLPKFGRWMSVMSLASPAFKAKPTLVPAHWINLTNTRGQYIIEPINYIFIVYSGFNRKPEELLQAALRHAGFTGTSSKNHSNGYYAYIGSRLFGQMKTAAGSPLTYANRNFKLQNDHFRIFGAYSMTIHQRAAIIYTASVSEESGLASSLARLSAENLQLKVEQLKKQSQKSGAQDENYGHHFVSFGCARNNLAVALIKAGYSTYYASMGNVVNTPEESTEDHDGNVYVTVIG